MSKQLEQSPSSARWPIPALTANQFFTISAFAIIFAVSVRTGVQSDTWWQLRTGKEIVTAGRPVITELWSSTVRGGYWPNHETLAEVIFYLLFSLGGFPLLAIACASMTTAAWYGLYRLTEGPVAARVLTILFCQILQSFNYGMRPYLFSLALMAVTVMLLPRRRLHWLYPPLFLVWANVHGGVAFGGLVLVLACVAAFFSERDQLHRWLLITAASGAATLLNPLGIGLWELALHTFNNPYLKKVAEWRPLSITDSLHQVLIVLNAITVYCIFRRRREWRAPSGHHSELTFVVCALVFIALSFKSIRNSAMVCIFAPLIISRFFKPMQVSESFASKRSPLYAGLLVALAGLVSLVARGIATNATERPMSPAVISAIESCDGPVFNTYNNGGYMLWWTPGVPVFVDSRQDPYPADLLFRAHLATFEGDYRQLFADYKIACAFVFHDDELAKALTNDQWREVARDEHFTVLRPPR